MSGWVSDGRGSLAGASCFVFAVYFERWVVVSYLDGHSASPNIKEGERGLRQS